MNEWKINKRAHTKSIIIEMRKIPLDASKYIQRHAQTWIDLHMCARAVRTVYTQFLINMDSILLKC